MAVSRVYIVDGIEYDSVDDVPEPFRSIIVGHTASLSGLSRRKRRLTPMLSTMACQACGYDLRGATVGGDCPECGSPVLASIQQVMRPRTSRLRMLFSIWSRHYRLFNTLAIVVVLAIALACKWVIAVVF